jgi:hypothetical protein
LLTLQAFHRLALTWKSRNQKGDNQPEDPCSLRKHFAG